MKNRWLNVVAVGLYVRCASDQNYKDDEQLKPPKLHIKNLR